MHIQSAIGLAVGPNDTNHWGQVLVLPTAYAILEIEDPVGDAQAIGVLVLSKLGDELSQTITNLSAVEAIARRLWRPEIKSLIILVPVGKIVYLVLRGSGSVYVKRGSELASLMHKDGAISGEVRLGDTLVLASHGFSRIISHDTIGSIFDHLSPSDVAEKLTLLLHKQSGGEGSVAFVFRVTDTGAQVAQPEENVEADTPEVLPIGNTETLLTKGKLRVGRLKAKILSLRHEPKRVRQIGTIVIVCLFIFSVTLGVWKQTMARSGAHIEAALSDAQHAFDEGVSLSELNPVKGRERLLQAKEVLSPIVSTVNQRTREGRRVMELYDQINDNLMQALQIVDSSLTLFYDLDLIKKGAKATSITLRDTSLAIADVPGVTVYMVDIASKKGEVVGGGDLFKGIFSLALAGDTMYVLTGEGIVSTGNENNAPSLVIKRDSSWGSVTSLVYFGGNLYVLDIGNSRIWKYTAIDKKTPTGVQEFSSIREYLNPDTLPDLSTAISMSIDGSVWIGTKTGSIQRFVQGKEETFIPKGVEPALGTELSVYFTDETKNMYVLDKKNNRVVVLDPEGVYLAQYRWDGSAAVREFVVSEEQKKILLLSDGKIYAIDLK